MSKVDLHLHTTFSDGKLTPTELVKLCSTRGLNTIAITDHDSTEGVAEHRMAIHLECLALTMAKSRAFIII